MRHPTIRADQHAAGLPRTFSRSDPLIRLWRHTDSSTEFDPVYELEWESPLRDLGFPEELPVSAEEEDRARALIVRYAGGWEERIPLILEGCGDPECLACRFERFEGDDD